jgi:hypothetical protein
MFRGLAAVRRPHLSLFSVSLFVIVLGAEGAPRASDEEMIDRLGKLASGLRAVDPEER